MEWRKTTKKKKNLNFSLLSFSMIWRRTDNADDDGNNDNDANDEKNEPNVENKKWKNKLK